MSAARARPSATWRPGRALGKRPQRQALKCRLPHAQGVRVKAGIGGAGSGALERLVGNALQKGRLLRELGTGLGDVPLALGAELCEGRQDLRPDAVASESRIEVRLVVGEGKPGGRGQRPGLFAREREQRADHAPRARAHTQKRPGAGRLGEAVDDGLGDVGARVAGGDPGHAEAGAKALRGEVASGARGSLEVAGPKLLTFHALDVEVDPKRGTEAAGGLLVRARGVAQAVVDVDGVKALGPDDRSERGRGARQSRRRRRPSQRHRKSSSTRPDASAASFSVSRAVPFVTNGSYAAHRSNPAWRSRKQRIKRGATAPSR